MRGKFATILFLVILVFLAVYMFEIFNKLFIESNSKFIESASAAFLGAFLAFIFVRIADFFTSYSDRITKGHSSLVKLQHLLNGLLTSLDDNIYIIECFEKNYATYSKKPLGNSFIWANRLNQHELMDNLIVDLINIDLINELFSLNTHLKKLNSSIDTINQAYVESKTAFVNKQITEQNYRDNVANIHPAILDIKFFHQNAVMETTKALAATRILTRRKPLLGYIIPFASGPKFTSSFEKKREQELNSITKEIEKIKKLSKERIQSILSNDSSGNKDQ